MITATSTTRTVAAPRTAPPSTARVLAWAGILTIVAIGGTFLLDPFRNFQLATAAAYVCAVAGLSLLIGMSGQLSLGHAALMAAGGYGYAFTANALHPLGVGGLLRFLIALGAAVAVATLLGWLLGLAGARLKGPYLAGVTLALVIALPAVTSVFSGVFRGDQGVQIPYDGVPEILRTLIALEQWQAWVAILVTSVVLTGLALVRRGSLGLKMRAVRDDEVAARLSGVRTGRTKVVAFIVSAASAGAGGAILCFVTQSVSPGAYTLAFSLLLVVAAVIGGLGSLGGAVIGSVIVVLLPWLISTTARAIPMPVELEQRLSGNVSILVFGVLLITVMLASPGGIAGGWNRWRARRARRATTTPAASAAPENPVHTVHTTER